MRQQKKQHLQILPRRTSNRMILSKYRWILVASSYLLIVLVAISLTTRRMDQLHQKQIVDLENQLALRDKTVEIQKDLYEKRTLQLKDVSSLFDSKDKQLEDMKKQIKRDKSDLLSLTQINVKLKEDISFTEKGTQSVEKSNDPNAPERVKVAFQKDVGFLRVDGFTLTNPPVATLKISQLKPLKFNVSIAQQSDGSWRTYVTSSESSLGVDIGLSAVNPYFMFPKWYEKIGASFSVGGGNGPGGFGVLSGLGLSYRARHFEAGPSVWFVLSDKTQKFVGANVVWYPFAR